MQVTHKYHEPLNIYNGHHAVIPCIDLRTQAEKNDSHIIGFDKTAKVI